MSKILGLSWGLPATCCSGWCRWDLWTLAPSFGQECKKIALYGWGFGLQLKSFKGFNANQIKILNSENFEGFASVGRGQRSHKVWMNRFLKKMANSILFFVYFCFISTTMLQNYFRPQRESNSDRWSIRQARWPLDHHHGPGCIKFNSDTLLAVFNRLQQKN